MSEQISLLLFMMIASKGAAGVTGAGLATLAGGLSAHRPDLVDGVGLIVGIDRFMSEARALTNFSGNAVATLLIGKWVGEIDRDRAQLVLDGGDPFDEATMIDDDEAAAARRAPAAPATSGPAEPAEPRRSGPAQPTLVHDRGAGGPSGGGPPPRSPFPITVPPAREHDVDDGERRRCPREPTNWSDPPRRLHRADLGARRGGTGQRR